MQAGQLFSICPAQDLGMNRLNKNLEKSNKKIKVFHSSVRKTGFSSRLIQTHLTFWLFSKKGILKVSKLCADPRLRLKKNNTAFGTTNRKVKYFVL